MIVFSVVKLLFKYPSSMVLIKLRGLINNMNIVCDFLLDIYNI